MLQHKTRCMNSSIAFNHGNSQVISLEPSKFSFEISGSLPCSCRSFLLGNMMFCYLLENVVSFNFRFYMKYCTLCILNNTNYYDAL